MGSMRNAFIYAAILSMLPLPAAAAETCRDHYRSEGTPMLQAITYKTWMIFPSVSPRAAFDRVTRAVLAEGFVGVHVEKALGTLTAQQETSGSGRPQTLRVVVRKAGAGSRVDALFMVQAGQIGQDVDQNLCRIVDAAAQ